MWKLVVKLSTLLSADESENCGREKIPQLAYITEQQHYFHPLNHGKKIEKIITDQFHFFFVDFRIDWNCLLWIFNLIKLPNSINPTNFPAHKFPVTNKSWCYLTCTSTQFNSKPRHQRKQEQKIQPCLRIVYV